MEFTNVCYSNLLIYIIMKNEKVQLKYKKNKLIVFPNSGCNKMIYHNSMLIILGIIYNIAFKKLLPTKIPAITERDPLRIL